MTARSNVAPLLTTELAVTLNRSGPLREPQRRGHVQEVLAAFFLSFEPRSAETDKLRGSGPGRLNYRRPVEIRERFACQFAWKIPRSGVNLLVTFPPTKVRRICGAGKF